MAIEQVQSSISGPRGEARIVQRGRWWIVEFQGVPGVGGLLLNVTNRSDAMERARRLVQGIDSPDNPKGRVPRQAGGD